VAQAEGAENGYYQTRAVPFRCKNAPLETLNETLRIRGFSTLDYYGEDADHDGQLDSFEDDGLAHYPPDDGDGRLDLGLVDLLTCYGDGRINLNTSPIEVLETLPLSDGAAEQIVAFRSFDDGSFGLVEDHAFRSPLDIEQLQGLSDQDRAVLKSIAKYRSQYFTILVDSQHVATGLAYRLEVAVKVDQGKAEILQWKVVR